ncbi:hypothetical protein N9O65_02725 [Schleiferiaceae bacterium]|nr:hypothetical protein [Schleiferiaceae bacterium]
MKKYLLIVGLLLFGSTGFARGAFNNSPYNAVDKESKAQDAEIYLGLPRYFNAGVRFNF